MAGAAPEVEVVIVGDPSSGSEWFLNEGCNACHSTGAEKIVGPGFAGIYERATTRGYSSPDDYIEASIRYLVNTSRRLLKSYACQLGRGEKQRLQI